MDPRILFAASAAGNFLADGLLFRWYVLPALQKLSRTRALLPLVLLSVFRTEGLVFVLPQVTGGHLPASFATPAAIGDFTASILAFVAALALRSGSPLAYPLVWLFNLEGLIDLVYATYQGIAVNLPSYQVGVAWFIPTLYVPLLIVSHLTIFVLLLRRMPSAAPSLASAGMNLPEQS
jgi:hypothetical protein